MKYYLSEKFFDSTKELIRKMKITCFLLFVLASGLFAAPANSQVAKVSITLKNASVAKVIDAIEKQSDYLFVYSKNEIDLTRKVSVDIDQQSVAEVLSEVFDKTNVIYAMEGTNIMLMTRSNATQQGKKVTGKVTDQTGASLPGVSVVVKGTTTGVITDANGDFTLSIVQADPTLVFSFVGMKSQEMKVGAQASINIVLVEERIGVEEVVVVGYGTQKKVNVTGSVSTISFSEQALTRPVTNVSTALSGLSSGVSVRQGVGKPGEDGATIRIRGVGTLNNSDPLVIIDGMEGVLDLINPNDIESVSILKDAASSSIYGSRAANGVILVTTKKGNKDRNSVNYSGHFSVAQPSKLLEFVNDYPQYMRLMNESSRNMNRPNDPFTAKTIEDWTLANQNPNGLTDKGVPNWLAFPNTDWQKEVFKNNIIQDHNISVNGGTKNTSFLLSAGYLDNPGLVENTGMKRFTFRANVEATVNNWLTVGTRTYGTLQDKDMGNFSQMLSYTRQTTPGLIGQYNGQYGYPEAPEESATANNLFGHLNFYKGDDKSSRFNTTLYSKTTFTKGLSWDFNFNYSKRFDEYNNYTNAEAQQRIRFSTGAIMQSKSDPSLLETYYNTFSSSSYTLENLLRYETTIAKNHSFSTLLGYNETYYFQYDHNSKQKGLIDASIHTPNSATRTGTVYGDASDRAVRSLFGRMNYGFKDRYLFEANLRYDGSSRFSNDSRWGLFPSFSAG